MLQSMVQCLSNRCATRDGHGTFGEEVWMQSRSAVGNVGLSDGAVGTPWGAAAERWKSPSRNGAGAWLTCGGTLLHAGADCTRVFPCRTGPRGSRSPVSKVDADPHQVFPVRHGLCARPVPASSAALVFFAPCVACRGFPFCELLSLVIINVDSVPRLRPG
jgi:hypothetical protein